MLVYLLEIDSPLVALMPILVTPLPTKNFKSLTTPHLHQVSDPRQASRDEHRAHELNVNKREMHLVEVEYCEDTRAGDHLKATKKQHKVLCKRLKANKVILHTVLLGVEGSIYTSHTLNHLKELGLDTQKAHKTALKLHAHSVRYANKLTTRSALEKSSCSQGLGLEQGAACHPPDPH